ncbi:DUF1328 family protein [Azorhizobium sp. AG788]|uniref:DUF1328 domain-containing protein n=1 Tax=Azorhizobium sp. AG788 TaxID=2183897 RepID=UPI003139AF46
MLKYAVIFLILSLIAGAMGFITVSQVARKISLVLFALFLGMALLVAGFVLLLAKATSAGTLPVALPLLA